MATRSRSEAADSAERDGQADSEWHIYVVPHLEMLFYSLDPVLTLHDGRQIDLRGLPQHRWTPSMQQAHGQLLALGGCSTYAELIERAITALIKHTIGPRAETGGTRPEASAVRQFCIRAIPGQVSGLPVSFATMAKAVPFQVAISEQVRTTSEIGDQARVPIYRQFILPCDGRAGPGGSRIGHVAAEAETAGPRYVRRIGFRKADDGTYRLNGFHWACSAAKDALSPNKNGRHHIYFQLWQLSDPFRDLCFGANQAVPDPPRYVNWALLLEIAKPAQSSTATTTTTTEVAARPHVENVGTVLNLSLDWPPPDLVHHLTSQAALVPAARTLLTPHAHTLAPLRAPSSSAAQRPPLPVALIPTHYAGPPEQSFDRLKADFLHRFRP
ncbi:hypothetical protein JCM10908_004478 [Rhodotorula pacifica]|uniref:uncharacterized protein n=1 Tax=Rhodotorula pacifica TaxID=1495444 RepID=UPI00317FB0C7